MGENYNIDKFIEKLLNFKLLNEEEVKFLCDKSIEVFSNIPNLEKVITPITLVGDIHGQLHDLIELFKLALFPPFMNYGFWGDYVDRGFYSIECICLWFCYKIKFPNFIAIIRGNHESKNLSQVYGFYDECIKKYGNVNIWNLLTSTFEFLPLSLIVDKKYLCMHGGLSPNLHKISDIDKVERKQEIPKDGLMCDLLWADPSNEEGFQPSSRGSSFIFGEDITKKLIHNNNLNKIVRAHQLMDYGYEENHDSLVVTIFSAPNYCYRFKNLGAIMQIDTNYNSYYIQYSEATRNGENGFIKRDSKYFY